MTTPDKTTAYQPIGCGDYEYIELACIDRYTVDVLTEHGTVHGLAKDTMADSQGEYFIVEELNGNQASVRVDHIKKITVLSKPRRFSERVFEGPIASS